MGQAFGDQLFVVSGKALFATEEDNGLKPIALIKTTFDSRSVS
jgi:hypothetical protein